MKKYALLTLVLFTTLVLRAQTEFSYGVKAGMNIATVNFGGDISTSDNITGFHIGPMGQVDFDLGGLGMDFAILYSQKGISTYGISEEMGYIDIPVNLRWKYNFNAIGFYVAAGPYASFRITGNESWTSPLYKNTEFGSNKVSAGFNLGAGILLLRHLQIGTTYGMGVTNDYTLKSDKEEVINGKTRTWEVSAALIF